MGSRDVISLGGESLLPEGPLIFCTHAHREQRIVDFVFVLRESAKILTGTKLFVTSRHQIGLGLAFALLAGRIIVTEAVLDGGLHADGDVVSLFVRLGVGYDCERGLETGLVLEKGQTSTVVELILLNILPFIVPLK